MFLFNENMVNVLTLLTTINGYLPQGAPTSPVLSNMVCFQLDNQLRNFTSVASYADFLSTSSSFIFGRIKRLQAS